MVLHREPVAEIRSFLDEQGIDSVVLYDMAHVLGLVGPHFQQPFAEGADLVTGSTHKTFFGTQRGVVGSRFVEPEERYELWEALRRRTFPGSVSNHHLGTLVGLLLATYEMRAFRDAYQPAGHRQRQGLRQGASRGGARRAGRPGGRLHRDPPGRREGGVRPWPRDGGAARGEQHHLQLPGAARRRGLHRRRRAAPRRGRDDALRHGARRLRRARRADGRRRSARRAGRARVRDLRGRFVELRYCFGAESSATSSRSWRPSCRRVGPIASVPSALPAGRKERRDGSAFGPRRALHGRAAAGGRGAARYAAELAAFETLDLALPRAVRPALQLRADLGPSRRLDLVGALRGRRSLFDALDYDLADPDRDDADILSYAAGHKAMGLYAMWALRDEIARLGGARAAAGRRPSTRLRLEDLLGFRRNPTTATPLFAATARQGPGRPPDAGDALRAPRHRRLGRRPGELDRSGHRRPRPLRRRLPAHPHLRRRGRAHAGARGRGPGRRRHGLARQRRRAPRLEPGLDRQRPRLPRGRRARRLRPVGAGRALLPARLERRAGGRRPRLPAGRGGAAPRAGASTTASRPRSIYRTRKGWKYGIEGRASHGAGHKLCSAGFYQALAELTAGARGRAADLRARRPALRRAAAATRCARSASGRRCRSCAAALKTRPAAVEALAARLVAARERLERRGRAAAPGAPRVAAVYELAAARGDRASPDELRLAPGATTTLREALGRCAAAPQRGLRRRPARGFGRPARLDQREPRSRRALPPGFWNAATNPEARAAVDRRHLRGRHRRRAVRRLRLRSRHRRGLLLRRLHGAARAHRRPSARHRRPGARGASSGEPYRPLILICGHAGLATGEDGPTHADPQALQLLQENFPPGTAVTLTPWEPQEIWPLLGDRARAAAGADRARSSLGRPSACSTAPRSAWRRPRPR